MVILQLIPAYRPRLMKDCVCLLPNLPTSVGLLVIHDKLLIVFGDESFKLLTCQLSMVWYWPTMAVTGNREGGFLFGEAA